MEKNGQVDLNQFVGNGEWEHLYDEVQILEETKMSDEERLRAAVPALLSWFSGHARILPWREQPTPYRVWLSEIMLQQTRVEAVKPYFERFIAALPDIAALAEAEEDQLLKLWEGLGYYSRVRNLNRSAKQVMEEHGGELPADHQKLLKLPGIGSYTAGAIASIAFGQKVPAVDGNVLRVISRVLKSREDISELSTKKAMEILLERVMPADAPGNFNQALMEVGATVCIPRGEPLCEECPFYTLCLSRRDGLTGEIPVKKAAKARRVEERTVFLITDGRRVAVRKRPEKGLLAGLYEFPNDLGWLNEQGGAEQLGQWLSEQEKLFGKLRGINSIPVTGDEHAACKIRCAGDATHIFSHVEWRMKGYIIQFPEAGLDELKDNWKQISGIAETVFLADAEELKTRYAIPNAFRAYTEKIAELLNKDRN
ncbi:MAG: A/G-specific adenine glycosylase [Lachnospiraceae bacterium]|nr:A/G-specific adenine glycosylase [Lachnospiraceae bacterium]